MILSVTRRIAAAAVIAAVGGLLVVAAGPAGASPSHRSQPQLSRPVLSQPRGGASAGAPHRRIGAAELSGFKVVLTVTRGRGQPPTATVTAAGYQRSGSAWKLISVNRIGSPGGWFWYAVQTCSLDITQFQAGSPVRPVDAIKVILLATPALGCTKPFHAHWKP
jgi:hypothetical protein